MTTKNETLFMAVLSQLTVNKIDYNILARDIGAPSKNAARMQWQYWKKKLNVPSPSKTDTSTPPSQLA
jgi:hypothetical protein